LLGTFQVKGVTVDHEKRVYQAIVWLQGLDQIGERTTVLADDLEAAERELKQRYGDDIVFSVYNEDEASRLRQ
jgi:hypothetical protein